MPQEACNDSLVGRHFVCVLAIKSLGGSSLAGRVSFCHLRVPNRFRAGLNSSRCIWRIFVHMPHPRAPASTPCGFIERRNRDQSAKLS